MPEIKVEAARVRNRVLTQDELQYILGKVGADHADAIRLSLPLGGMRLGELCEITQLNTDFDKGTIILNERKADIPKKFYMTDTVKSILRHRFLSNGGVAFSASANVLSQKFGRERKRLKNISSWRFHDLRGSLWNIIKENTTIETAQALMGHTTPETTLKHYARSTEAAEREALAVVDGFVAAL